MDLVGGPFAVIESDPGVFTSLTRNLGIHGLELVEMYDIEPWAVDHLNPHGLIFCFMWRKDTHRPADFDDPSAERVWFANQLSDDACATHAILNVVLNCPGVEVGEELRRFREDTRDMSPVMRGLAITNSPTIRSAHNALARPSDIRASLNNITLTALDAEKKKKKERERKNTDKPPPAKRARTTPGSKSPAKAKGKQSTAGSSSSPAKPTTTNRPRRKRKVKPKYTESDSEDEDNSEDEDKDKEASDTEEEDDEETYHFIGYVPAHGKVWELDGLKSGPLEVGELPPSPPFFSSSSSSSTTPPPNSRNSAWMDVVRPALRLKMEKYGGSGSDNSNIRFSLLAIVDDAYQKASDELEWCKREREKLERRLDIVVPEWRGKVDASLLDASFLPELSSLTKCAPYAPDFALRRQSRDIEISRLTSPEELIAAWEGCMREAMRAKVGVEDEVTKGVRANTDHIKRTWDYEPFIRAYLHSLHREGLLFPLLDRDADGRKVRKGKAAAGKVAGGKAGSTGAGAGAGAGAGGETGEKKTTKAKPKATAKMKEKAKAKG